MADKSSNKNSTGFYREFLFMTLLPLIICGIVMMLVSSYSIKSGIKGEIRDNLKNASNSVLLTIDGMYPGEYEARLENNELRLYKGGVLLREDNACIDLIKQKTGMEISVFIMDTRLLTTLFDKDGKERLTGTTANEIILDEVYENGRESFFDNVTISGVKYFAYYIPLMSSDTSECVGMIGAAKSAEELSDKINGLICSNLIVMALGIFITTFCIVKYAHKIVGVVKIMIDYMKHVAGGNLDDTLSEKVTHRRDELGEMGRMLDSLRKSLRRLIERDALTGLYNRRSAEKKIDALEEKGFRYCVAIGDIDHFKNFNDTYGHDCGDAVLKSVASILNGSMKDADFAARWGGEEFLLVFENKDIEEVRLRLLGIRDELHETEIVHNNQAHKVTMTFGAAQKQDGLEINKLIKLADDKLYEGKESGRDRVIT